METNRYLNRDKEILIKRYEELRGQVLNNGILHYDEGVKNKGYVLFLRHGMAGWLKAWFLCKELEPASPEEKLRPVNNPITDDMKYQAIIILANMALYSRKEIATLC